jgi:peptide/nickel transport system substrate-binding protein
VAVAASLILAACTDSSGGGGGGSNAGGSSTLTFVDSPETTVSQTYNPFNLASPAYQMGTSGFIYEPLLQFNLAHVPDYYPWLATSFKWSDGGKAITFTIRQGVKFSNGQPMTPSDVAFSYNLVKKYPAVNSGGLVISGVSTSGDTVTITFPAPSYGVLEEIASVYIVPQSQWQNVSNPGTWSDPNPIGTGPYMTTSSSFTPQGFTLYKNPHYWQAGKPKIDKIYFPVYTSNDSIESALLSGQIDWAGNYFPNLNKVFVAKDPTHNHFWMPARSGNVLIPNLKVWPTNQLAVRQAISDAIDRLAFVSEGESNYGAPITSATGILLPNFSQWVAPQVANMKLSATADPAAAKQVLEKAGYKLGSDGFFRSPSGQLVSLTIVDPTAFTDYAQEDALAASELQAAGIKATFQGQDVNGWEANIANGKFQLAMHWTNQGVNPYALYDGILDSSLNPGSGATGDYEGLNNPAINAQLKKVVSANTIADQTAALAPLEQYVAQNLPVIPTLTEPGWFEYTSTRFTGWPTPSNAYEQGSPVPPQSEVVILNLKPA